MKLKASLREKLPVAELDQLVQSYDVVGDIAIIIIPKELEHRDAVIGSAILDAHPTVKVVTKRVGNYNGEHRTIRLAVIAGENRKETIHKEFGLTFKLNPEQVYFSVRSATERKRIADLVSAGEHVLVMFSGIGPYPLHISTFSSAEKIVGIEKNPAAHVYALENLARNKVSDNIMLHHGDVSEVLPRLGIHFDRIIMPLPTNSSKYLPLALKHLNPGGYIHHYVMQRPETLDLSILDLATRCKEASRRLANYAVTVCGHTGPSTYRYCIDALIH